jgi:hypothetical protein
VPARPASSASITPRRRTAATSASPTGRVAVKSTGRSCGVPRPASGATRAARSRNPGVGRPVLHRPLILLAAVEQFPRGGPRVSCVTCHIRRSSPSASADPPRLGDARRTLTGRPVCSVSVPRPRLGAAGDPLAGEFVGRLDPRGPRLLVQVRELQVPQVGLKRGVVDRAFSAMSAPDQVPTAATPGSRPRRLRGRQRSSCSRHPPSPLGDHTCVRGVRARRRAPSPPQAWQKK